MVGWSRRNDAEAKRNEARLRRMWAKMTPAQRSIWRAQQRKEARVVVGAGVFVLLFVLAVLSVLGR